MRMKPPDSRLHDSVHWDRLSLLSLSQSDGVERKAVVGCEVGRRMDWVSNRYMEVESDSPVDFE
jgi:hypothetical protein